MSEFVQNVGLSVADGNDLRKRIMKRIYTRWLLTRKLPQVALELGVVVFLTQMSRPRIFFGAVFHNALEASTNPVAYAKYFLLAYANTTPGVKMLFASMVVIGFLIVRDILSTRRYAVSALR